jgi:hypothetical protein
LKSGFPAHHPRFPALTAIVLNQTYHLQLLISKEFRPDMVIFPFFRLHLLFGTRLEITLASELNESNWSDV